MSTFLHLDSKFRDREIYPNENEYEVTPEQSRCWFSAARTVRAYPANTLSQPLEFATSVKLLTLTLPYTVELASIPLVYVRFSSTDYTNLFLIKSINDTLKEATYICRFDRIQYDANNVPMYIHYQCGIEQVMRYSRDKPVKIAVVNRDNQVLPQQDDSTPNPPNDTAQTFFTFEITPYIRDGDYDNHMTSPYK